jgi:hypothetical protein
MVEPIFNTVPGVARTALVGVTRQGVTHPVLCVEMDRASEVGSSLFYAIGQPRSPVLDELMAPTGARFGHTRRIMTFLRHPGFPVDVRHNSKIFREELAAYADQVLGNDWDPGAKAQGRPSPGLRADA